MDQTREIPVTDELLAEIAARHEYAAEFAADLRAAGVTALTLLDTGVGTRFVLVLPVGAPLLRHQGTLDRVSTFPGRQAKVFDKPLPCCLGGKPQDVPAQPAGTSKGVAGASFDAAGNMTSCNINGQPATVEAYDAFMANL